MMTMSPQASPSDSAGLVALIALVSDPKAAEKRRVELQGLVDEINQREAEAADALSKLAAAHDASAKDQAKAQAAADETARRAAADRAATEKVLAAIDEQSASYITSRDRREAEIAAKENGLSERERALAVAQSELAKAQAQFEDASRLKVAELDKRERELAASEQRVAELRGDLDRRIAKIQEAAS